MESVLPQYAVIGNPIAHSKSPIIHQLFAKSCGIALSYKPCLLTVEDFNHEIKSLVEQGLKGTNVTLPFKENAFRLSDVLTEEAEEAAAVNTLTFKENVWIGHNTDGNGLLLDLKNRHKITLKNKRILVLGAGGAVRGILGPLLRESPQEIIITNRTFKKAELLATVFKTQGEITAVPWNQLKGTFNLIINGTSSSLQDEFPALPCEIDASTEGYDLVYSQKPTSFMEYLSQKGAKKVMDGLGMLVEQAALSFEFWHGVYPETESVYQYMRHGR